MKGCHTLCFDIAVRLNRHCAAVLYKKALRSPPLIVCCLYGVFVACAAGVVNDEKHGCPGVLAPAIVGHVQS